MSLLEPATYRRMLTAGVARGAVEHRMRRDGLSEEAINRFHDQEEDIRASRTSAAAVSETYRRMRDVGLVRGALEHRMRRDGLDSATIAGHLRSLGVPEEEEEDDVLARRRAALARPPAALPLPSSSPPPLPWLPPPPPPARAAPRSDALPEPPCPSDRAGEAVDLTSVFECAICLDDFEMLQGLAPCGHQCVCEGCARKVQKKPCPVCREKVMCVVAKVYKV